MKQKQKLFARDNYELRTCTELVLSVVVGVVTERSRSAASRREGRNRWRSLSKSCITNYALATASLAGAQNG